MIAALHSLDRRTALGVLARAALSLEGDGNPAARTVLENETEIREKVIAAARKIVGLSESDVSADAIEKIGDFLDQQSERLVGPSDMEAALRRLAESGSLPTDMYEVQLDPSLRNWLRSHYDLEVALVNATIRRPDKEEHYARDVSAKEPSLASLFIKRFRTKWPYKDFSLLVVAMRNGLVLNVSQAWRIYPSLLDVAGATSLVDVLRRFANEYGHPTEWEGQTGSFFLTVDTPLQDKFNYKLTANIKHPKNIAIAQMTYTINGKVTAALAVVIDMTRYVEMLDRMAVSAGDMLGNPLASTVAGRPSQ